MPAVASSLDPAPCFSTTYVDCNQMGKNAFTFEVEATNVDSINSASHEAQTFINQHLTSSTANAAPS